MGLVFYNGINDDRNYHLSHIRTRVNVNLYIYIYIIYIYTICIYALNVCPHIPKECCCTVHTYHILHSAEISQLFARRFVFRINNVRLVRNYIAKSNNIILLYSSCTPFDRCIRFIIILFYRYLFQKLIGNHESPKTVSLQSHRYFVRMSCRVHMSVIEQLFLLMS